MTMSELAMITGVWRRLVVVEADPEWRTRG